MAEQKNFIQHASDHALLVNKRVRYSAGQLLGVGEFSDEQQYHLARHAAHQLFLHGYGTVAGLNVEAIDKDGDVKIMVSEGMGVDRRGRVFTIPGSQCASLKAWLNEHPKLPETLGTVYVVACYDSANTDAVTLVGQPCSNESEAIESSRVMDGFRLELRAEKPPMPAWVKVRSFSDSLATMDLDAQAKKQGVPVVALLRQMYLEWVLTDLPKVLQEEMADLDSTGQDDPSVILLAEVTFERKQNDAEVSLSNSACHQGERPYLLHTQLIQELAHGGAASAPEVRPAALRTVPLVTITSLGTSSEVKEAVDFELWFHLDLGTVTPNALLGDPLILTVYSETASRANLFKEEMITLKRVGNRNLYQLSLPASTTRDLRFLRFVLPLSKNTVKFTASREPVTLFQFMQANNMVFEGYNGSPDQPAVLVYARYVPAVSQPGIDIDLRRTPLHESGSDRQESES